MLECSRRLDQTTVQFLGRVKARFRLLSGAAFTLLYLFAVSVGAQAGRPPAGVARKRETRQEPAMNATSPEDLDVGL